jgi:succinate-acetate transporter protein
MVLVTTGACLTCCVLGAGTKLAAAAVLTAAALRFGFTGAYELTGSRGWEHTAGVTGAVLAALAFYAAAAALLEGAYRRPVLPMFRTGPGKRGQRGTLDDQLVGLHNEPGIRLQM